MPNIGEILANSLNNALLGIANFLPRFVAGLIILLIGIIVSAILKQVIIEVFKALKVEVLLKKYGVPELKE
ncbi:MAG: hypothetical protein M1450_05175, partial [Patescibacteria group bacterium]|nr:hypothetical protein [Patescibacteria group bacterium]